MRDPIKIIHHKNDLKKGYILRLEIGLIFSLLIFIATAKVAITPSEDGVLMTAEQQEIVHIEKVVQTRQEIKAPPPPRPVVPVEVPNDEIIENEIINLDAELNMNDYIELPPAPPSMFEEEEEEEDEIFVVVEQMPELIGGLASIQKHIKYPEMAILAGIEGRVVVQIVIDENGDVQDPVVVRGIGGGCDEEAVKAVQKAKFVPGKQRGKPVSVRFSLPINFSLKEANS